MITGHGETKSTPDIVVSMMDLDPTMTNPKPASYLAIADGEKQLNMAKVVSGVVVSYTRTGGHDTDIAIVCRPLQRCSLYYHC